MLGFILVCASSAIRKKIKRRRKRRDKEKQRKKDVRLKILLRTTKLFWGWTPQSPRKEPALTTNKCANKKVSFFFFSTEFHRKVDCIEYNEPLAENRYSFGFDNVKLMHSVVLILSLSHHTEVTGI